MCSLSVGRLAHLEVKIDNPILAFISVVFALFKRETLMFIDTNRRIHYFIEFEGHWDLLIHLHAAATTCTASDALLFACGWLGDPTLIQPRSQSVLCPVDVLCDHAISTWPLKESLRRVFRFRGLRGESIWLDRREIIYWQSFYAYKSWRIGQTETTRCFLVSENDSNSW